MYNNNANIEAYITAFGSAYETHYVRGTNRPPNTQARLNGSNYSYVEADVYDTGGEWDDTNDDGTLTKVGSESFQMYGIKNQTLGIHSFGDKQSSGSTYNAFSAFAVHTPIHTSSHYQTFETIYTHELVGGDRNMEQTNLVVTPDGKTWDEVTRDTSYLQSNICINASLDTGTGANWSGTGSTIFDTFRGILRASAASTGKSDEAYQKDFAISYDRFICLVPGTFKIHVSWYTHDANVLAWRINKNDITTGNGFYSRTTGQGDITVEFERIETMNRGDYIHLDKQGSALLDVYGRNRINITRIE